MTAMNDTSVRHAAVAGPVVAPPVLHSPAEIAEALNVSPGTVRRWIREGSLRALLVGGQWRVPAEALERFLRNQEA